MIEIVVNGKTYRFEVRNGIAESIGRIGIRNRSEIIAKLEELGLILSE